MLSLKFLFLQFKCLRVEQLHAGFNEWEQNVLSSRLLMLKSSKKWQDCPYLKTSSTGQTMPSLKRTYTSDVWNVSGDLLCARRSRLGAGTGPWPIWGANSDGSPVVLDRAAEGDRGGNKRRKCPTCDACNWEVGACGTETTLFHKNSWQPLSGNVK